MRGTIPRLASDAQARENKVGFTVLNGDFGDIRTIMVFGAGRGGTSVASGCLRIMGVAMGLEPHPLKHEWSPIVYEGDRVQRCGTRDNIACMNGQHDLWGWKSPADFYSIEQYFHYLRDPGLLIVTRDVTDVSLSALRNNHLPAETGLYEASMVYSHIFDRARFIPFPKIVVSYDYITARPYEFAMEMSTLLGIRLTESKLETMKRFSSPVDRKYRMIGHGDNKDHTISPEELRQDANRIAQGVAASRGPELRGHVRLVADNVREVLDTIVERLASGMSEDGCFDSVPEDHEKILAIARRAHPYCSWGRDIRVIPSDQWAAHVPAIVAEHARLVRGLAEQALDRMSEGEMEFDEVYRTLDGVDKDLLILLRVLTMMRKVMEQL